MKQKGRVKEYTQDFREAMVRRIREEGISAYQLSQEVGVSASALYKWLKTSEGVELPSPVRARENGFSSEDKFHAVMETYSMNATEIAEYCRTKGIYPEQLQEWRKVCLQANAQQAVVHQQLKSEIREEKQTRAKLERELRRKEKALAEAAALLILRKKAEAIWGDPEEE